MLPLPPPPSPRCLQARGLYLGLYTCAGDTTCKYGRAGSQDHYDIDAQRFASWGVKFVKVRRGFKSAPAVGGWGYRCAQSALGPTPHLPYRRPRAAAGGQLPHLERAAAARQLRELQPLPERDGRPDGLRHVRVGRGFGALNAIARKHARAAVVGAEKCVRASPAPRQQRIFPSAAGVDVGRQRRAAVPHR